ncbi:MAG: AAA family ATPase [Methylococcales bacterium]|nr:AAA family ATPase [Methylococcales bacterium]
MRILAIRGKNLASLAEPFEILLNEGLLQTVGLFAITGATGAGKSTILDALCLALYDKMPRLPEGHGVAIGHKDEQVNLRVTSNDVRSILRRGTSHAYAEVDFIGKDKTAYRARWEVSKARGKASGRLQAQDIILSNIASGQRLGQGKKNTLELISELIDLSFDQFCRSVLLAQGDFAAFLKAKKDERSSLLERITGTDIYSELSIAAFERARTEKEALAKITALLQHQVPLGKEARLVLEQQLEQLAQQVAELDKQVTGNQIVIDWYVELKKRRQAQQLAADAHINYQQQWAAASPERALSQKVAAVQPLRPLLSQYLAASVDVEAAKQAQATGSEQYEAITSSLQTAQGLLSLLLDQLQSTELQQQQAVPLLLVARDLDTRIGLLQNALTTLTAEELQANQAMNMARQRHQSLRHQQTEKLTSQNTLTQWLAEQQALKPIAAEWPRWEVELGRHRTLTAGQTAQHVLANQLTQAISKKVQELVGLKTALDDHSNKQHQQLSILTQLKQQCNQQPLEALYQQKEALEQRINLKAQAISLVTQAQELQQRIKLDTDKLAGFELQIKGATEELQAINQQETLNGIALSEAQKALDLIQASTHKNADQFRQLLVTDQPCPVCGALEHPWQGQHDIENSFNNQANAQMARVSELQNLKESLIKQVAELQQAINHAHVTHSDLTTSLPLTQAKLDALGLEWAALGLSDKPDFAVTSDALLDSLNTRSQKLLAALALLKSQEKTALALQNQIQLSQDLYDQSQQKSEKLAQEYSEQDKALAKLQTDLKHTNASVTDMETQRQSIAALLQTAFMQLDGWQAYLQGDDAELKTRVQAFQQAEQALASTTAALTAIGQDEMLAAQALEQSQLILHDKQTETRRLSEEKQALMVERESLFPVFDEANKGTVTADSYEQSIKQAVTLARAAQQQASEKVTDLEKELARLQQQQAHWQQEAERRNGQLQQAKAALELGLEKHAIDLEQLSQLLTHDDEWLSAQQAKMQALEQGLQEALALLKVQGEACLQHESQGVDVSEDAALQTAKQLDAVKQTLMAQKEEQSLLLREDDKKIAASSHLKAELDRQQSRWQQWESLNELIGSSSGTKFRVFAQSLTLEALLAYSNQHLEDFATRYQLQRVPSSELELQIIDRDMADDVRSIHSLSGGECFLVSLALALGLASLSSNKTQVESLFIDEGFGSLDPETLDIAIASLDTLQALGRKVGVISHVPILVERIGAKVVVEKQGGGRSRVVVGGY